MPYWHFPTRRHQGGLTKGNYSSNRLKRVAYGEKSCKSLQIHQIYESTPKKNSEKNLACFENKDRIAWRFGFLSLPLHPCTGDARRFLFALGYGKVYQEAGQHCRRGITEQKGADSLRREPPQIPRHRGGDGGAMVRTACKTVFLQTANLSFDESASDDADPRFSPKAVIETMKKICV